MQANGKKVGEDLLRAGDLAGAAAKARSALADDPGRPGSRSVLAQVALHNGRNEEALDFALQELAIEPGSVPSLVTAAKSLKRLRRLAEASSMWLRVAKARPESSRGLVEAARCELALRDYKRALVLSDRALKLAPNDATALALKIEALLRLNRSSELVQTTHALAALEPEAALAALPAILASRDAAGAEQVVKRAVAASARPLGETQAGIQAVRALKIAARNSLSDGHEALAAALARSLLALNPAEATGSRLLRRISKSLLTRAREACRDGALDAAQVLYARLLCVDPMQPRVALAAATLAERRGDWQEAARILNGLAVHDPSERAYVKAARASELAGDLESALRNWVRVLGESPDQPKAAASVSSLTRRILKTARTLQDAGNADEAIRLARLVLLADTQNASAQKILRKALTADGSSLRSAVAEHDTTAQEDLARRMLLVNPDRVDALRVLSSIYWETGRIEEAGKVLQRLVSLQPSAALWVRLARCLRMQKRSAESVDAARQALLIDPDNPAAKKLAGDTLPAVAA